MAKRFVKSVLHAGQTYHGTDGDVTPTPARLKHWRDSFDKITAAKYNVPVDWDHADTLDKLSPVKMSEQKKRRSAKNTVGELAKFDLAPDGNSALLTVELTDPVAQGRAERNEVYVSPVILDKWKDGHGTEYADVFGHVDLVNHPVDHSQSPFVEVPKPEPGVVALALRMGLGKPAAIRLGENPFAKKDGDGDGKSGEGEASKEAPPDADSENKDMPKDEADEQQLEAVMAHLRNDGYGLPADTDASNLVERLLTACLTKEASKQKAEAEEAEAEEKESDEEKDMTVADPGYAAMSLDTKRALAYAERSHREQIKARLDTVLENGQCNAAEHTAWAAQIGAVKLSLDDKGEPTAGDLEKWVASREAVPKGTFWTSEQRTAKRMSLDVANPPAGMDRLTDDLTDAEVDQTANWAMGRKPAAAVK